VDGTVAYRRRWQILAVLCLCLILIGLDALVLNLALPSIQQDLGASASQLQWMVDAYALASGGLLLLGGGLADRFGRKRLLTMGVGTFGLCSLGAAFSTSPETLVLFRGAMGVGAAMMMPATLAIIKDVFPAEEQAKAIGIWAGAAAVGVPLGPVLSGLLLEYVWWGALFLVNVPPAAAALLAGTYLIPESRNPSHPGLDLAGVLLSVVGLTAIVYGLVEAPRRGWAAPATLGSLGLGVLLLAAFTAHERRSSRPMLDVDLFRNPSYGGGAAVLVCLSFGLYSGLFLLTLHLQLVLGLDPLGAGLRMFAIGTMMVGAPLSSKLVESSGPRSTTTLGLLLCTVGFGFLAGVDASGEAQLLGGLAVFGLGMGITLPAAVDAILAVSDDRRAGAGSAVSDTSMQVGGALGIAVSGSMSATVYRDRLPELTGLPAPVADTFRDSLAGAATAVRQVGADSAGLLTAARSAFVEAMGATLLVSLGVALAGAVFASVVLPRERAVLSSAVAEPPRVERAGPESRRSSRGGRHRRPRGVVDVRTRLGDVARP
jgi:EmrB/QacA subfamily drug resistance transporter